MKTSEFHSQLFERSNFLLKGFLTIFFRISSWPRLLIEVFLRRGFGSDYTSLFSSTLIIILLGLFPYWYIRVHSYLGHAVSYLQFVSWYVYLIAFGYKSWIHHRENVLPHGQFDFNKHSQFSGYQDARFFQIRLFRLVPNSRLVATIYEPGLFFVIGLALAILQQPLGSLLMICGVIYSLGYFGAYSLGRLIVQETINVSIFSEEMQKTMVNGKYPQGDKGFEFFDMPVNPEYRRKMADFMTRKDDVMDAY